MREYNKQTVPLSPQLVREAVDKLGEDYAADPKLGTPAEKITTLLTAITAKCVMCRTQADGSTSLSIADCTDRECPLNDFGMAAFKMVRVRLEIQGGMAGGIQ